MQSKKATLHVCLLNGLAMVIEIPEPSSGQDTSTATEAPRTTIVKSNRPTLGLFRRKLSLRHVQAHPSAYNVRYEPYRRSVCEL